MSTSRTGLADKITRLAKLPRPAGNFISLSSLVHLLDLPLASARVAAKRLEAKQILTRVGPGLYANLLAEPSVEQLASLLWRPSYISLEWALAFHGISQQKPAEVTCVTLHRPRRQATALGTLSYAHVSRSLYFGFKKETVRGNQQAYVAEPEKALLDWIYLRRQNAVPIALDELDLRHLRPDVLKQFQKPFPQSVQRVVEQAAPADQGSEK